MLKIVFILNSNFLYVMCTIFINKLIGMIKIIINFIGVDT